MQVVTESQSPRFPERFAERYQVLRRLGRGGMAQVYKARDLSLHREVAIKVLREDYIDDPDFLARFRQEARAAANLVHPNIVTVYDFGGDGQHVFIIMEYVDGTDLKTLIRRRGSLEVDAAVELMQQICAGVGYAHRAGLVHCDLKPHNILVTADQRAKITDFGIARALSAIRPDEKHETVWGSPQYFAPEQAAGGPPSPATDVYSLGVLFYEMLTGHLPFYGEDPAALTELHQTTPPPPPRVHNPSIPSKVEQIVLKVLAKEPAARYRTADQFGQVLKSFATGEREREGAFFPGVSDQDYGPNSHTAPMQEGPGPGVDWAAVALGLLAFVLVGGLIPLWLWACLLYPSCPLSVP